MNVDLLFGEGHYTGSLNHDYCRLNFMKLTSVTHTYYYPQILVLSNGNGNCTQVYFHIMKITEIKKPLTLEVMVGCCKSNIVLD